MKLTGDIRCDFEKVTAENIKLKDRILGYQETINALRHSLKAAKKSKDCQVLTTGPSLLLDKAAAQTRHFSGF